jgi:hypothetical protein
MTYLVDYVRLEIQEIAKEMLKVPLSEVGSIEGEGIYLELRVPRYNRILLNSDYYFSCSSIAHITSFQSAIEILTSGCVWATNLKHKNDGNEYQYISSILNTLVKPTRSRMEDFHAELNVARERTFILSTTHPDNVDAFWDLDYSCTGAGIGLELSFVTDPLDWENYYLSRVYYGEGRKFEAFRECVLKIMNEYNMLSIKFHINPIISLHKEPLSRWVNEKEIRIVGSYVDDVNTCIYRNSERSSFKLIKLPILSNNPIHGYGIQDVVPFFKLSKIHVGPKVTKQELCKLKTTLAESCSYKVEIIKY